MAKMILQNVRGSYVFATNPRKKEDGTDGNYGLQILMSKDDPQYKKLQKLVIKTLTEKVGEAKAKKLGKYKLPIRDGDDERDGDTEHRQDLIISREPPY